LAPFKERLYFAMRVLLQNTETQLYFMDEDQWTDDPLKATDFEEVERAADAYDTLSVAYARIVVEPGLAAWNQHPLTELVRRLEVQGGG
jgi:hypothetical protein